MQIIYIPEALIIFNFPYIIYLFHMCFSLVTVK